jgi:hypothetical protein
MCSSIEKLPGFKWVKFKTSDLCIFSTWEGTRLQQKSNANNKRGEKAYGLGYIESILLVLIKPFWKKNENYSG